MKKVIPSNWPQLGFILAGLINVIGILVVTHAFQSHTLSTADPVLFSSFGLLMIILWGLAYFAAAPYATMSVALPLVFAVEKLAYTIAWLIWRANTPPQTLAAIIDSDFLGGTFMSAYGINDGLFVIFFLAVAIVNFRKYRKSA